MEASLLSALVGSLKVSLLFCIFLSHHQIKSTLKNIQETRLIALYNSPDKQLIID